MSAVRLLITTLLLFVSCTMGTTIQYNTMRNGLRVTRNLMYNFNGSGKALFANIYKLNKANEHLVELYEGKNDTCYLSVVVQTIVNTSCEMRPELCEGLRLVKISLHEDIRVIIKRIESNMRYISTTEVNEKTQEMWKSSKSEKYDILKVFFKTIKECKYNCELY